MGTGPIQQVSCGPSEAQGEALFPDPEFRSPGSEGHSPC